jgi:peptide/nickel transport system ATP-binding protein
MALLEIEDLRVAFRTRDGLVPVLRGFDLTIGDGETVAVVGESGSGKTVMAQSVMRLLAAEMTARRLRFDGRDILAMDQRALQDLRGPGIGMIFQEPMVALNPVLTLGEHIGETIRRHQPGTGRRAARQGAIALLQAVQMPDAAHRVDEYPHRLSGGQRQRAMIAMALACRPRLLIADEPTTALDATVQAQILALLRRLQQESGIAILLISHDLHMVSHVADRVVVLYGGDKVEEQPAEALFRAPAHPYSRGLLGATPRGFRSGDGRLQEMPGRVPDPRRRPPGCGFAPRCPAAFDRCRQAPPALAPLPQGGAAACFLVTP